MNKKKFPILSVILYILAGLLMVFAIWSASKSISYISLMISQGQLVFNGNEYDIVSFLMASCAQYVVFAVVLFTLGWMLQKGRFVISNSLTTEGPVAALQEISEEDSTTEEVPDDSENEIE